MTERDPLQETLEQCRECGDDIEPGHGWTADEKVVCNDCWFGELSGDERKEIAERAHKKREERRAE